MYHESSDSDDEHQLLNSISNLSNLPHHMDFHMMGNYPTHMPIIEINRRPAKKGRTGVVWSAQFDQFLREAVESIGLNKWDEVCLAVHGKILSTKLLDHINPLLPSVAECEKRWRVTNPPSKNYPPWSEEEKHLLQQLIDSAQTGEDETYAKSITIGKSGERVRTVSWVQISARMRRSTEDVTHMWSAIRTSRFKRGQFSEEEDKYIIDRVRAWDSTPPDLRPRAGLWVTLEREMSREDKRISERYRNILAKKLPVLPPPPTGNHNLLSNLSAVGNISYMHHPPSNSLMDPLSTSHPSLLGFSSLLIPPNPTPVVPTQTPLSPAAMPGHKRPRHPDSPSSPVSDIVRWNEEMDAKLLEGMARFGNRWGDIADLVNTAPRGETGKGTADANKCRGRWYRVLRNNNNMSTVAALQRVGGMYDDTAFGGLGEVSEVHSI